MAAYDAPAPQYGINSPADLYDADPSGLPDGVKTLPGNARDLWLSTWRSVMRARVPVGVGATVGAAGERALQGARQAAEQTAWGAVRQAWDVDETNGTWRPRKMTDDAGAARELREGETPVMPDLREASDDSCDATGGKAGHWRTVGGSPMCLGAGDDAGKELSKRIGGGGAKSETGASGASTKDSGRDAGTKTASSGRDAKALAKHAEHASRILSDLKRNGVPDDKIREMVTGVTDKRLHKALWDAISHGDGLNKRVGAAAEAADRVKQAFAAKPDEIPYARIADAHAAASDAKAHAGKATGIFDSIRSWLGKAESTANDVKAKVAAAIDAPRKYAEKVSGAAGAFMQAFGGLVKAVKGKEGEGWGGADSLAEGLSTPLPGEPGGAALPAGDEDEDEDDGAGAAAGPGRAPGVAGDPVADAEAKNNSIDMNGLPLRNPAPTKPRDAKPTKPKPNAGPALPGTGGALAGAAGAPRPIAVGESAGAAGGAAALHEGGSDREYARDELGRFASVLGGMHDRIKKVREELGKAQEHARASGDAKKIGAVDKAADAIAEIAQAHGDLHVETENARRRGGTMADVKAGGALSRTKTIARAVDDSWGAASSAGYHDLARALNRAASQAAISAGHVDPENYGDALRESGLGNMESWARHFADKHGDAQHFFTAVHEDPELSKYDDDVRRAIAAVVHKLAIGKWPTEKRTESEENMGANAMTESDGGFDSEKHPRDERGRFTGADSPYEDPMGASGMYGQGVSHRQVARMASKYAVDAAEKADAPGGTKADAAQAASMAGHAAAQHERAARMDRAAGKGKSARDHEASAKFHRKAKTDYIGRAGDEWTSLLESGGALPDPEPLPANPFPPIPDADEDAEGLELAGAARAWATYFAATTRPPAGADTGAVQDGIGEIAGLYERVMKQPELQVVPADVRGDLAEEVCELMRGGTFPWQVGAASDGEAAGRGRDTGGSAYRIPLPPGGAAGNFDIPDLDVLPKGRIPAETGEAGTGMSAAFAGTGMPDLDDDGDGDGALREAEREYARDERGRFATMASSAVASGHDAVRRGDLAAAREHGMASIRHSWKVIDHPSTPEWKRKSLSDALKDAHADLHGKNSGHVSSGLRKLAGIAQQVAPIKESAPDQSHDENGHWTFNSLKAEASDSAQRAARRAGAGADGNAAGGGADHAGAEKHLKHLRNLHAQISAAHGVAARPVESKFVVGAEPARPTPIAQDHLDAARAAIQRAGADPAHCAAHSHRAAVALASAADMLPGDGAEGGELKEGGTSDGAKKGWETRRGGGGDGDVSPHVKWAADAARAGIEDSRAASVASEKARAATDGGNVALARLEHLNAQKAHDKAAGTHGAAVSHYYQIGDRASAEEHGRKQSAHMSAALVHERERFNIGADALKKQGLDVSALRQREAVTALPQILTSTPPSAIPDLADSKNPRGAVCECTPAELAEGRHAARCPMSEAYAAESGGMKESDVAK